MTRRGVTTVMGAVLVGGLLGVAGGNVFAGDETLSAATPETLSRRAVPSPTAGPLAPVLLPPPNPKRKPKPKPTPVPTPTPTPTPTPPPGPTPTPTPAPKPPPIPKPTPDTF